MDTTSKNGTGNAQWDRLPGKGYYMGLSRQYWYLVMREGKIKTALLKKPGRIRGVRLVWRPSALAYIEKHVVPGDKRIGSGE